jgi:predicted Mrr-cat superfamily restriction endonuclease
MDLFNINLFQMKTKPENKESASDFLQKGYVRIGWSKVPDMSTMEKEEIREELEDKYGYQGRSLSTNLGTLNTFAKVMKKGDVVLINTDGYIHIGIIGKYVAEKMEDGRWCHKRYCDWVEMINKEQMKEEVKSLLRNMTTVTKFPHPFVTSGIPELLGWKEQIDEKAFTQTEQDPRIIIEDNESVTLESMQHKFLSRLESLGGTALGILEEEMKSDDSERRRKAAVDLLNILNDSKSRKDEV